MVYSGRARVLAANNGTETTVGLLTRGNYFGEQGLLTDSRRHFTVRAASDLTLLRLSKEDFARLLSQRPGLQEYFKHYISETSIRNFLKLCTVLSPLSPTEIRDLLDALKALEYDAGAHIIREGEPGDAFYILRNSSAEVVKESDGGKVLKQLRAGDAFGELALLTGQPRAASIITKESASVFRLEKTDFDRIIATAPKVREAIVNMASGYSKLELNAAAPDAAVEQTLTDELPAAPETEADNYKPRRARRYPALLQLSEMDCGAACMAMILRYYGKHVSINRLRDLVNVSREGATLYSVAEGAERIGFNARGIRAAYDHLAKVELPAIAHWEGYHYIVLYEATPEHVVVADPAIGRRRLSRAEFEKGWTGYLLLLTPTQKIEGVAESKTTFGRFLPLLKPHRKLLFEIFLASLLLQLFGLATPIFTQVIVDKVLVHKSMALLNMLLVGRSGSGKSTFANMLLRLHEPNEGRIFVDGYDLRQVSISSLRAQVGVVPQEIFLFSGTIRENVAFGDPDAPLEQVVGAAMLAGAHEFISELPLGYETKIGERGQSLSGGQKQRIAIARALFKKPRILIFDEATSALDTESERAIQQNLDQILKDRTTFIIAHRFSTVRNADLIVVMDKGAIIELGTHYSLMEEQGMYYYLNSPQLEG